MLARAISAKVSEDTHAVRDQAAQAQVGGKDFLAVQAIALG